MSRDPLFTRILQRVDRVLHPQLIEKFKEYPDAKTVLRRFYMDYIFLVPLLTTYRLGIVQLDGHRFIEKYILKQLTTTNDSKSTVDLLSFALRHVNSICVDCQRLTHGVIIYI